MASTEEKTLNSNGGQVFVPITNKDVWIKLQEVDKKVDALSIKLYAFSAAVVIIGAFISITGGIQIGN